MSKRINYPKMKWYLSNTMTVYVAKNTNIKVDYITIKKSVKI